MVGYRYFSLQQPNFEWTTAVRARLVYEDGNPRVVPTPTGYLIDCSVETPPPDDGRSVWIEMTTAEAHHLQQRIAYLLWKERQIVIDHPLDDLHARNNPCGSDRD